MHAHAVPAVVMMLVHAVMARACGSLMGIVLHCIFIDTACAALLSTKALTVTAV